MNKLYQPILFFFLLPVFYIALGSGLGLPGQSFNGISFLFLYLFVLVNQMLENIFLRIPRNNFEFSKYFVWGLEVLLVGLLLYFGWRHSWLAALTLLLYALIVQSQFVFSYYHLENAAVLTATFLKVVFLNGFAFYLQTHFMLYHFFPVFLGLFIPFYLFELSRTDQEIRREMKFGLLAVGYAVGLFFLWEYAGRLSFLLFLSLPFAGLLGVEFNRKTAALFAFVFSFIYIGLIFFNLFAG